MITVVLPDGDAQTAPRSAWYKLFGRSWGSKFLSDYVENNYHDLYAEWAIYESGIEPNNLASRYIEKNYAPKIERKDLLTPNAKVYPVEN